MKHEDQLISPKGFEISWESERPKDIEHPDGFSPPREWQIEAFNDLKNSIHMILNAPMGSGKSWMMCLLSAYKMQKNPSLRCIIAVPQIIIASGFMNAKLLLPDGEKIVWAPYHNLCDEEVKTQTVKYLIRWLNNPQTDVNSRILVCTHSTLVAAYKLLMEEQKTSALENTLLWIDEAHHVKHSLLRGSNNMGAMVNDLITEENPNVQVGLTTATFFRGDRNRLLSHEAESLFSRYNLPYDRYLKTMKHLRSFCFDFVYCGQDYMNALEQIIRNNQAKDIIYIPRPMSRHSKGCKYTETKEILHIYQTIHGEKLLETGDGLRLISSSQKTFKILDLVDENRQKSGKKFLGTKELQKNKDSLDTIITLDMFKEGANWIWADRGIIIGPRGSLVDVIQMIGRLFRDAEGKKHVNIIQLLPFSVEQDSKDTKENLNDYLKAIYSSLILEDILNPVQIRVPKERSGHEKIEPNPTNTVEQSLFNTKALEHSQKIEIFEAATTHLVEVAASNDGMNKQELYTKYQSTLSETLKELNIPIEESKAIGARIWSMHDRRSFTMRGINVQEIDIQLVNQTHPLDGLLAYTSGVCNISTFDKLKTAIDASKPSLSIGLVHSWIEQHIQKYEKKPSESSGIVEFACEPHTNITWRTIADCIARGGRGLEEKITLANYVFREFGILNHLLLAPISEVFLVNWIEKFIEKYGRKPYQKEKINEGVIEFANGEFRGLKWADVHQFLYEGFRGLGPKSSLPQFIEGKFGIRSNRPDFELSIELIRSWILDHMKEHSKRPNRCSGVVEAAAGINHGITWMQVADALSNDRHGLTGGLSLPAIVSQITGVPHHLELPPLPESQIIEWAHQFIFEHGRRPTSRDGLVHYAEEAHTEIKWSTIDNALRRGGRGLKRGSSLARLLDQHLPLESKNTPATLSESLVISYIHSYYDKYGKMPRRDSGSIEFTKEPYKGLKWETVDSNLKKGTRGLPKSTLSKLCKKAEALSLLNL